MNQTIQTAKLARDLKNIINCDVWTDILHRAAFSTDASIYRILPVCIVSPQTAEDIAAVVKYAVENNIPVVARGAASGLAGESLSSGIVFDMTRYMNKIIGIEDEGKIVVCQPGAVLNNVNDYLAPFGRKIGPDPSSSNRATIGGSLANNATGAHSLQYGYMGEHVHSIEAVLSDGSIVEIENGLMPEDIKDEKLRHIAAQLQKLLTENNETIAEAMPETKRNRCGYSIFGICNDGKIDLARLLGGSEGTLAVFTQIKMRTVPLPKSKAIVQIEFATLEKMAEAVPFIIDTDPATCELMDKSVIAMARDALPHFRDILPADAEMVLLVEHIGETEAEVHKKIDATINAVSSLAANADAVFDEPTQQRLWKSRKDAVPLLSRKKGPKHTIAFMEDVSVDYRKLADYIRGLIKIAAEFNLTMSYYGHAGDGELHIRPWLDLSDPAEVEKMRQIAERVFALAWSLGGSISGEHADGLVRAAFIKAQYGEACYNIMRKVKNIFDPHSVLNPGKIINEDVDIMIKNLKAADTYVPERLESQLHFLDNELRYEIEQCSGCGVCLSNEASLRMCPMYRALGEELASSRAKANILHYWMTGGITEADYESAEFRKFLDLCLNCKACSLQCPSGVDISKIMSAARAEYIRRKGLRKTEFALSKNKYLSMAGNAFAPISNFFLTLSPVKWMLEKTIGLDSRRDMPAFNWKSFVRTGRRYLASQQPVKNPIDRVAYFIDTYANYNDHELGFAVLDILRHNNIECIIPKQKPAPLPAIVYGDVKTARRDLEYIVKQLAPVVKKGYKIICSEPSAALCLKQELRHFVTGPDAELISCNVYELTAYLFDLLKQDKLKIPQKRIAAEFSYHKPCHLMVLDGDDFIELSKKLCDL
ncbi:MAG: FAD-linked oxidase C-terminal domain-containing protein, partial [Phycisphaerae bacterium]|nr:FAD-linked oxidase C-terminal domain-containing protein [Phycisphaerae bacterium]